MLADHFCERLVVIHNVAAKSVSTFQQAGSPLRRHLCQCSQIVGNRLVYIFFVVIPAGINIRPSSNIITTNIIIKIGLLMVLLLSSSS